MVGGLGDVPFAYKLDANLLGVARPGLWGIPLGVGWKAGKLKAESRKLKNEGWKVDVAAL